MCDRCGGTCTNDPENQPSTLHDDFQITQEIDFIAVWFSGFQLFSLTQLLYPVSSVWIESYENRL